MDPAPATAALALAPGLDAASEAGTEPAAAVDSAAGDGEPAGLGFLGAVPAAAEHDETQAAGSSLDQDVSVVGTSRPGMLY